MTDSNADSFVGSVVVIVGASRGLGRETALAFARRGAQVVVNYRANEAAAAETLADVEAAHPEAGGITVAADASKPDAVASLFDAVREAYGRVDVFVHNAAVTAFKPLDEVTPKDVSLTYGLGVTGFLVATQEALDLMDEGGSVIAVSGNDSHTYMPLHGLLASAKAAMECLVRYLAVEQAAAGVRVNAVNPGLLDKENYYTGVSAETAAAMEALEAQTPMGGAVPPSAVADTIVMLAGPGTEWVTGQVLNVDGGLSAR